VVPIMADLALDSPQNSERACAWPFVSVIVITYQREDVLFETVARLLDQDYAEYEIVVVDQTEQVSESTQRFFAGLDGERVRYVHIDEVGLPNARSVGIRLAKGEVVLFVDDDACPRDERFVQHHAGHYHDPAVLGVTGRILDPRYPDVIDADDVLRLTRWGAVTGWPNAARRTEIDVLHGANMSFRRDAALQAGLFSTNILGSAQYEDTDMSLRLRRTSEGAFLYDPRAAVDHRAAAFGGCNSRSISPLLRHIWRFHNMTYVCLQNPDVIDPLLYITGRLAAAVRIAFQLRSLQALYWLPYSLYLGIRTYKRGRPPERQVSRIQAHFSANRGAP
jgi:GT2 family glycosyltransferase